MIGHCDKTAQNNIPMQSTGFQVTLLRVQSGQLRVGEATIPDVCRQRVSVVYEKIILSSESRDRPWVYFYWGLYWSSRFPV